MTIDVFIQKISVAILNPLIWFAFVLAVVYFLYGIFIYIREADNEEKRKDGANHILWGAVGMFIMFSAYGIIRLVLDTLNIPYN